MQRKATRVEASCRCGAQVSSWAGGKTAGGKTRVVLTGEGRGGALKGGKRGKVNTLRRKEGGEAPMTEMARGKYARTPQGITRVVVVRRFFYSCNVVVNIQ